MKPNEAYALSVLLPRVPRRQPSTGRNGRVTTEMVALVVHSHQQRKRKQQDDGFCVTGARNGPPTTRKHTSWTDFQKSVEALRPGRSSVRAAISRAIFG